MTKKFTMEEAILSDLHIMDPEEYKQYILPSVNCDDAMKEQKMQLFTHSKDSLVEGYGTKSFAVLAYVSTEHPLSIGEFIEINGMRLVMISDKLGMFIPNSIRDSCLYELDELEDFTGDNVYNFLNAKLYDKMVDRVESMNPIISTEEFQSK